MSIRRSVTVRWAGMWEGLEPVNAFLRFFKIHFFKKLLRYPQVGFLETGQGCS